MGILQEGQAFAKLLDDADKTFFSEAMFKYIDFMSCH